LRAARVLDRARGGCGGLWRGHRRRGLLGGHGGGGNDEQALNEITAFHRDSNELFHRRMATDEHR
jgi:hypothetical protein